MREVKILAIIAAFWSIFSQTYALEPISTGIALAAVGAYLKKDTLLSTSCALSKWLCVTETCADYYIPVKIDDLRRELQSKLFGQHIVISQVTKALEKHFLYIESSKKPLVMSFHGTPGVGKNFVAEFIAKSMFLYGAESKFVHKYSGRLDFPVKSRVPEYSSKLRDEIYEAIEICPKSLFIFDEVDSMPSGVFDTITSLLDHHQSINGLDFRKAVFIFLSNTGGLEISEILAGMYRRKGFLREHATLQDFEHALELTAYNVEGGLKNSKPIEASLIDHFIPFLPLERRHIEGCIEAEFQRIDVYATPDLKEKMFGVVTFEDNLFAKNGCKRLSKKAEIYV